MKNVSRWVLPYGAIPFFIVAPIYTFLEYLQVFTEIWENGGSSHTPISAIIGPLVTGLYITVATGWYWWLPCIVISPLVLYTLLNRIIQHSHLSITVTAGTNAITAFVCFYLAPLASGRVAVILAALVFIFSRIYLTQVIRKKICVSTPKTNSAFWSKNIVNTAAITCLFSIAAVMIIINPLAYPGDSYPSTDNPFFLDIPSDTLIHHEGIDYFNTAQHLDMAVCAFAGVDYHEQECNPNGSLQGIVGNLDYSHLTPSCRAVLISCFEKAAEKISSSSSN